MKKKILLVLPFIPLLVLIVFLISDGVNKDKKEDAFFQAYLFPNIEMSVNGYDLEISFIANEATQELYKKIGDGTLTIEFSDYGGFEKVGELGFDLPSNDEATNAKINDVMLYQGNKLVLFYGENSYSYTRLGRIINMTGVDLKTILSGDNVTITLKKGPTNFIFS